MTTVRSATVGDLPAIRSIQVAALPEPWPGLLEPAVEGAATTLVAESDGVVLGYVVALGATGGPAYVPELAVDPASHRQGIGTTLVDSLCRRLAEGGHPEVRLAVREADRAARSFSAAPGFEPRDRLPDEFDTGDGVLLVRPLTSSP